MSRQSYCQTFFLTLALLLSPISSADDAALLKRVNKILDRTPLIDGHNDIPWSYKMRVDGHLHELPFDSDLSAIDRPTHTDIPRLRAGRMGAQFWSVYVPIKAYPGERGDASRVLDQIDFVHRMVNTFPDHFEIALTAKDIERIHKRGKIASLMGIEGGHAIENSLGTLRGLYRAGARYMTLTHSKGLRWADSATDDKRIGGLSPFGKEVVREMNRLGMMVDLSHVSPAVMHDALDVSTAPVIFSHSSAYALTHHKRNIPDDVLRRLADNNGVAMVTFFYTYVNEQTRLGYEAAKAAAEAAGDDPEVRRKIRAEEMSKVPWPTLSDVADHIDHFRDIAGIDHIGIGGDYDGMPPGPVGLEDVSTYPALFVELLKRGYSNRDIEKIAGKNLLRVMKKVESVAAKLQKTTGPSDKLIDELDGEPKLSAIHHRRDN